MKNIIYYICSLVCLLAFLGTSCNLKKRQGIDLGDMQCGSVCAPTPCGVAACSENLTQNVLGDSSARVNDTTPDESAECFLDSLQAMRVRMQSLDDSEFAEIWFNQWHGFSDRPTMHEFIMLCTMFFDSKDETDVVSTGESQYFYLTEHPDFFKNVSVWLNALPKELRYQFLYELSDGVFFEATFQRLMSDKAKNAEDIVTYLQDKVPDFFDVLKDNEMEVRHKGFWVYFGERDSTQLPFE